ncbi:MAG: HAMP domain-containing histidine kinase [Oscillospiraceae bacterium]|nr:HAMP domain-containing histidine kinase [Oscillospiraceae bacterium]
MRGRIRPKRYRGLAAWLAIESTILTITSVMSFVLLRRIASALGADIRRPILAVVIGVVIGTAVGLTATWFSRRFNQVVSGLTRGLRSVAEGNFTVRLDPGQAGPLKAAYTDFNNMVEELQSVRTLREDFINNFSHEFKTPITAIQGFAELLQEPGLSPEDRQQYLQIIAGESARLAELSNSTLLLSKLESQRFIPEKTLFALDEQVKLCVILLSSRWEKQDLTVSVDLEPAQFYGNAELMRHIWLNVLNNAITYTPSGGAIGVTLRRTEDWLRISVSDTGIGMTPEVRAHIFDKYYQGDPSHTGKGLGLGLSIVYRIVELCGGQIAVESCEGTGSVFTISLPGTRP